MAKGGSRLAAPDWNARRSPVNADAPWPEPKVAKTRVLEIQRKLHKWARAYPVCSEGPWPASSEDRGVTAPQASSRG